MLRHLPNFICLLRILMVVPTLQALTRGEYGWALAIFAVAAVSDGVDGFLAKTFGWTSALGKVLDPLADKLLLVSVFLVGAWLGLVPWWVAAVAIARDLAIGMGALIFRLWFGPLHGKPTVLSKVNTGVQIVYLVAAIMFAGSGLPAREWLKALAILTVATTLLSGAGYVGHFARRAWNMPPAVR